MERVWKIDSPNVVYFVLLRYRPRVPTEIWEQGEEVSFSRPEDFANWPSGGARPQDVLCVSRSDATVYRIWKFREEVPDDYAIVGKNYVLLEHESLLPLFLETANRDFADG